MEFFIVYFHLTLGQKVGHFLSVFTHLRYKSRYHQYLATSQYFMNLLSQVLFLIKVLVSLLLYI